MLNIIIFGSPGSGKGTQSAFIKDYFNLTHISTGDLLRSEIKKGSEIGKKAEGLIAEGKLVPDEVILGMIQIKLQELTESKGVIFDGFPRTVEQARALDKMLSELNQEVTLLVELEVEREELIKRIIKRGEESGRVDDNEASVKERLKVYAESTMPVIEHYKEQGKYVAVPGMGEIAEITKNLISAIDSKR